MIDEQTGRFWNFQALNCLLEVPACHQGALVVAPNWRVLHGRPDCLGLPLLEHQGQMFKVLVPLAESERVQLLLLLELLLQGNDLLAEVGGFLLDLEFVSRLCFDSLRQCLDGLLLLVVSHLHVCALAVQFLLALSF